MNFRIKGYFFIVVGFLLATNSFALEINDLMLVHVTDVRPSLSEDGHSLVLKTGGSRNVTKHVGNQIFVTSRDFSRPSRVTLHWSINKVTRSAGTEIEKGKFRFGISARYAIVEPISSLHDAIWGGRFDDFYSVGDHEISKNAYLLVPDSETDVQLLKKYVNVSTYKNYREGFTNEDMRGIVAQFLESIDKPRIVFSGILMDEDLLSQILKITLNPKWNSISNADLIKSPEFIKFNTEQLNERIDQIISFKNERHFICREVFTCPAIALFISNDGIEERHTEWSLRTVLENSSYFLPDFGILHAATKLYEYEEKLLESYKDNGNTIAIAEELRKYVESKFYDIKNISPPKGFYQVMKRIQEVK